MVLLWTSLLLAPSIFAQDEAPAPEQEAEETEKSETNAGSQETEYNDDNYRRFMELKDQPTQTSSLPTNSYQSGTQKLDELPEASQKHLRNQLREIILESDEWAPGDEEGEYPFVASEAGEKNTTLKQQEAEAWGELVGKYHEREAQIYANAERSNSAAGQEGGAPDSAQANAGESDGDQDSGSGEGSEGNEQKQKGEQGQSAENQTASNANEGSDSQSSSSTSAGDPNAVSTEGVSQSALEYLLGSNSKTGNSNEPGGSPGGQDSNAAQQQQAGTSDPGQTGSPGEQTAAQQAAAQQSASEQSAAQQAMAQQQAAAEESAQTESESLSQQQSSEQQNQQQQATQQNPSEFVVISKGTLSIKELQNAQGITISTGSNTPGGTEEDHLRKDDDG